MSLETNLLRLNDDTFMPYIGLGVYKMPDNAQTVKTVSEAIRMGYRMIDTASVYKNEDSIGKAIIQSGVDRSELFVISKIWNTAQRIGDIEGAFERSLNRLKLDYIDLYLIHWPVPGCYASTWKQFEAIRRSGRARSIGVSNFEIPHLEHLFASSGVVPAINQIECHPLWNRAALVSYCQAHGIAVQAYSPIARGAYADREILTHIGNKYGKTSVQVALRYLLQRDIPAIPRTMNTGHQKENLDIFDFALSDLDIRSIDSMDEKFRSSSIPDDLPDYPR